MTGQDSTFKESRKYAKLWAQSSMLAQWVLAIWSAVHVRQLALFSHTITISIYLLQPVLYILLRFSFVHYAPPIKMSLAAQLWLTPSDPQLPLFDESGPVCFPAPPGVWCMTATPLSEGGFILHRWEKGNRAGSSFPTPPFHRAPQNLVERYGKQGVKCTGSGHPVPMWCTEGSKQERHVCCTSAQQINS